MCLYQIVLILQATTKKEGLNLPTELARRIAIKSDRNLRRALLACEVCRVQQYPFSPEQEVNDPDWQLFLRETANMIIQQQSPKRSVLYIIILLAAFLPELFILQRFEQTTANE